ncbi:MAG: hypothetical protein KAR33_01830 [Candidatus Thorarchaeota archaeon]|nr:hypothetical protein [Candidatus Thorarchaeota archaeon]
MSDMTGESRVVFLKQWRNYIILLVIILLIPYRWALPYTTTSTWFTIEGLFYILTLGDNYILQMTPVYLLSAINLILLIIPSIYFTYRKISRTEKESIKSLGLVTILLTLIVLAIISKESFISNLQYDTAPSPTPNLQYLPGFSLLLLFFTIIVPIFTREDNGQDQNIDEDSTGILGRIKEQFPKTGEGWLTTLLFILPAGVTVSFLNSGFFVFDGNLLFEVFGSFYTSLFEIVRFGQFTYYSGSIVFGGIVSLDNLLGSFLWSTLLVVFALLYLQEKIQRRLLIVGGLLSIIPHLFLMFSSIFLFIYGGTSFQVYVPLPLLQICVVLIIRRVNQMKGIDARELSKRRGSEIVKVPIGYILTSSIRRLSRGFRREEKESPSNATDTQSGEEVNS